MHLKTSAEAGGATKKTEKKRMYANFNMAAFLALTLDFRKADLVKSAAQKNYLRIRILHLSLLFTTPCCLISSTPNVFVRALDESNFFHQRSPEFRVPICKQKANEKRWTAAKSFQEYLCFLKKHL